MSRRSMRNRRWYPGCDNTPSSRCALLADSAYDKATVRYALYSKEHADEPRFHEHTVSFHRGGSHDNGEDVPAPTNFGDR